MPEYLAPGVYVEETSYRAKSIQGVATSTTGFVGTCLYGPTQGPAQLVTSFEEYQRYFGGIDDLIVGGARQTNYMAHGVRAFFDNGGTRLYVARIEDGTAASAAESAIPANRAIGTAGFDAQFRGRFPGRAGNVPVRVLGRRGGNQLVGGVLTGLRLGDVVEASPTVLAESVGAGVGEASIVQANVYWVEVDDQGHASLFNETEVQNAARSAFVPAVGSSVQRLSLTVVVNPNTVGQREDVYGDLTTHERSRNFIGRVLRTEDSAADVPPPRDRTARVWIDVGSTFLEQNAIELMVALANDLDGSSSDVHEVMLGAGTDGGAVTAADFAGTGSGDSASGLLALAEVEDIAIVAAPSTAVFTDVATVLPVHQALTSHCERLRYRFAILGGPRDAGTEDIRELRAQMDSKYAALYYPWVVVADPFGAPRDTLTLPPEGFIAGVYGRSDTERGVHKAPANEVVRGALRFSTPINKGIQDVLNPLGINCLRFFEGRGYRVWGARTITSDPEWIYLNVRRLFIFMENSIDRGTQWAVFEPNNEELWLKLRLTIESFLTTVWRTGALLGTTPDEAFFVRCDRTTMTQDDLDNGRVIVLIGVAPTKPAEFVVFRIGQWTADASII